MCRHSGRQRRRLYDPSPVLERVHHLNHCAAARRLGVDRWQVMRWRLGDHWMEEWTADRVACNLGHHPFELWCDFGDHCCRVQRVGMFLDVEYPTTEVVA